MCIVLPFIFCMACPGDFRSAVFRGVSILALLVTMRMNFSLSLRGATAQCSTGVPDQPQPGRACGCACLPHPVWWACFSSPPASSLQEAPGKKSWCQWPLWCPLGYDWHDRCTWSCSEP